MSAIRRAVAFLTDPVASGSRYDDLTSGAITDCTDVWPIQGLSRAKNASFIDRNDLLTGLRGALPPESFKQDPRYTMRGRTFPRQIKQLMAMVLGTTDSRTGTPPASITHALTPLLMGASIALPAKFMQFEEDAANEKASGVVCNSLELAFGNDGDGTYVAELWALYRALFGSPPSLVPAAADLSAPTYKLRDLKVYFAGSGTPTTIPIVSAGFKFENNLIDDQDVRFVAGKNVAALLDAGSNKHYVQFPNEHRIGAEQTVTGSLGFADVQTGEDLKHDLAVTEKIVIEVVAGDIATTPPAKELMRITVENKAYSDGNFDDVARGGAAKSQFSWTGYVNTTTGASVKAEFVDASNVNIAV